jgi:RNA polymerase sigma factor (sigma-70 family)
VSTTISMATEAAPSRRGNGPPNVRRLLERRAALASSSPGPPYDPVALVESVVNYAYDQAGWYARRRFRPDLRDDLAHAAIVQLQADANAGKYRPEYAPTTWAHQVCRTVIPREFNRIAWAVRVPVIAGRGDEEKMTAEQVAAMAVVTAASAPVTEWNVITSDGSGLEDAEEADRLLRAVDSLPDPFQSVIRAYYGIGREPLGVVALGKEMSVSREWVRNLKDRGERMLRAMLSETED